MSSSDEDDAMEASARFPDGEPASPEAHGAELGDEEALLHSLSGIVSRVDRMERSVDELDRFFASKKALSGSGRKPASKGKGRKVGIKFRDAEVDAEFLDVGVNDAAPSKRMQEIMRRFGEIFRQILKHQWAGPFMDPVDVEGLQLHDYYKIIKKPMDFNTIKNRMAAKNGSGYKNVREIYADVRLVFTNAMTYNGEKNEYHVMAKALLGRLEDKWLDLLPMVLEEERRQEEAQTRAKINRQIAQEAVMMKMAKDTNDELTKLNLLLEELRETVVHKCRKMSAEDKRQLSKGLCRLSLEDIFKALEIVAKKDSSLHSNLEVVDLDLDKQSESTLWKLRSLLREAMEHKKLRDSPNELGENSKHKNLPRGTKNSKCKYQNNDENNNLKRKEICDAPTNNVKSKKLHPLG